MSDNQETVKPTDDQRDRVERRALKAAFKALGDLSDPPQISELAIGIAKAHQAAEAVRYAAEREFWESHIRQEKYDMAYRLDDDHIVATALAAKFDAATSGIDEWEPYSKAGDRLRRFAGAVLVLEAAHNLNAMMFDLDDEVAASEAGATLSLGAEPLLRMCDLVNWPRQDSDAP